jgi:hypothetical protein
MKYVGTHSTENSYMVHKLHLYLYMLHKLMFAYTTTHLLVQYAHTCTKLLRIPFLFERRYLNMLYTQVYE